MSENTTTTSSSAPEAKIIHRLTNWQAVLYGLATFGGMGAGAMNSLSLNIFNITLGVNAAKITLAMGLVQFVGILLDPMIAHISDNLNTRWGRRRPLIVAGSIIAGLTFAAMWMFPTTWSENAYFIWYLCLSMILNVGASLYGTGYFALGIEVASDYQDRTRIMAIRTYFAQAVSFLNPWLFFLAQLSIFSSALMGVRWIGAVVGGVVIASTIPCVLFVRERFAGTVKSEKKGIPSPFDPIINFFKTIKSIGDNRYFWMTLGVAITLCSGLSIFEQIGYYVNFFYVFQGNTKMGAFFGGCGNSLGVILAALSVPTAQILCHKLGKHVTLRLALCWMLIGSALKWWCYTPANPYLMFIIPFFYSVGISSFWMVLPAMQADVVDIDELNSGKRREAMFGAVTSLGFRISSAISIALMGVILNATGFSIDKGNNANIGTSEIVHPQAMLADMKTASSNEMAFLWAKFTKDDEWRDVKNNIAAFEKGRPTAKLLVSAFEEASKGRSFYDEATFANVPLSPETRKLAASNPSGTDLSILNTKLLRETFPNRFGPLTTPLEPTATLKVAETVKFIMSGFRHSKVSAILLDTKQIEDPLGLLNDLRNSTQPASAHIWSLIAEKDRKAIAAEEDGKSLRDALAKGLSKIICTGPVIQGSWFHRTWVGLTKPSYDNLYDNPTFRNVQLSDEALKVVASKPSGYGIAPMNRILITDALKKYIVPNKQKLSTYTRMRFMYSFAMACTILLSLLFLVKYDLTAQRMEEVRKELERRRGVR